MARLDTADDPMGDVDVLVSDLHAAHLDRRRAAFVSCSVHFPDRASWERATGCDLPGWRLSAYSRPHRLMIQVSRSVRLTVRDLEESRAAVRQFAREHDGEWDALVIEDLAAPNDWDRLAQLPWRP